MPLDTLEKKRKHTFKATKMAISRVCSNNSQLINNMENETTPLSSQTIEIAKQIVVDTLQKAVGALKDEDNGKTIRDANYIGYNESCVDYIIKCYDLETKKKVFLSKEFTFCEDALDALGFKYEKDAEDYVNKIKAFYAETYADQEILFRTRKCTLNEIGHGE